MTQAPPSDEFLGRWDNEVTKGTIIGRDDLKGSCLDLLGSGIGYLSDRDEQSR